jgi:hypothetical protein
VVVFSQEDTLQRNNKHPVFNTLCTDLDLQVKWCTSVVERCKAVANETIMEWDGNSSGSGGYLRAADRPARELRPSTG